MARLEMYLGILFLTWLSNTLTCAAKEPCLPDGKECTLGGGQYSRDVCCSKRCTEDKEKHCRKCSGDNEECNTHRDCCGEKARCIGGKCILCTPLKGECIADDFCCGDKSKCIDRRCSKCIANNQKCTLLGNTTSSNCCQYGCILGLCQKCKEPGEKCKISHDCCSLESIDCRAGVCQKCLDDGAICEKDSDCCYKVNCVDKMCVRQCGRTGKPCGKTGDKPCCTTYSCQKGTCQTCVQQGKQCNNRDECCNGNPCITGKCKYCTEKMNEHCDNEKPCCYETEECSTDNKCVSKTSQTCDPSNPEECTDLCLDKKNSGCGLCGEAVGCRSPASSLQRNVCFCMNNQGSGKLYSDQHNCKQTKKDNCDTWCGDHSELSWLCPSKKNPNKLICTCTAKTQR